MRAGKVTAWVVASLGLAACRASTGGADGTRSLREALDLHPIKGHVERAGGAAWLVDDGVGGKLAKLPEAFPEGGCDKTPPEVSMWRLYEGSPAVALGFDSRSVVAVWRDEGLGCQMSAALTRDPWPAKLEVLAAPDLTTGREADPVEVPEPEADSDADASEPDGEPTEPEEEVEPGTEKVALAIEGRPPLTAVARAFGLTITAPDGSIVYDLGNDVAPREARCGSAYTGLLERGEADGVTYLHYSWKGTHREGWEGDENPCASPEAGLEEEQHEVWLAFTPGKAEPAVRYTREETSAMENGSQSSVTQVYPMGALELVFELYDASGPFDSRNGDSTHTWSWKWQRPGGDGDVLAATPGP